jgi:hypothetical protein
MAKTSAQPSPAKSQATEQTDSEAAVDAVLKDNPEIAAELENLTPGEKLIRLRQRGLIDFDVQ